jgi:hypothetical protein
MKKLILTIFLLQAYWLFAQNSSRNGYYFAPSGTVRAFFVFAEVINDPQDGGALGDWQPGKLPPNIDTFIDHSFTNASSVSGYLTKYYYEASLGNFIFLGDYYPNLIQIDYNTITDDGASQVMAYLNNLTGTDITTKHGYTINSNDFDMWTPKGAGIQKINSSDNYLDVVIILWRSNSKFTTSRGGGHIHINNESFTIKSKIGSNCHSDICSGNFASTIRHEFAHALHGGNDFHSGGSGAGYGTYLSDVGGYSILSSWNKNLDFANAWDRWRLGWKLSSNSYYISARTTSNAEVNADFVYGQAMSTNEFILRDFATYGDAIRIKLPYLKSINSSTKEQYIWIENHQLLTNKIEYNSNLPKGIRLNIQVGNDDLTNYSNSTTNYLSPYSSFGNYDFTYSTTSSKSAEVLPPTVESYEDEAGATAAYYQTTTSDQYSNPFTGYHLLQNHAINYIDPNGTSDYDKIYDKEYVLPKNVFFNGNQIFNYYPIFGNQYDAFPVGSVVSISTNPSSAAALTYRTPYRYGNAQAPNTNPNPMDNRYIFLNGLSIEVLEQKANGDVRVRIKWNNFDVNDDIRWCGPIVLTEKIYLKPNKTIRLDLGLSPTKPVNPITYGGNKVFADPTIFYCKNNSYFKIESNSKVDVANYSTLILESGSTYEVNDGSVLSIKSNSTLQVKSGANLIVKGSGQVEIEAGAFICLETGANVNLQDYLSVINLKNGYQIGVNASVPGLTGNCSSNPTSFAKTGNGSINTFSTNNYIQNQSFTINDYLTGFNIFAGTNVTTSKPQGSVIIQSGANVVFDADGDVILDKGFEVQLGGGFEAK